MTSGALRQLYAHEDPAPILSGPVARPVSWALRVPLLLKLIGANLLIDVAIVVEPRFFPGGFALTHPVTVLLLSTLVTTGLVWLALRPIAQLEATAERVSAGDFNARVPVSPVADRRIGQLSLTVNRLLDRVQADRARIQYLAGRTVRARDIERESVAREIRDSLAQMVSGIALQIAAMRRGPVDAATELQLKATSNLVDDLADQMRGVAEALYPGTISEFGLANALSALCRVAGRRSGIAIEFVDRSMGAALSPAPSGALYRVAEEALRNVAQHANATKARAVLTIDGDAVTLTVEDDGRGVDLRTQDVFQTGLGLFSAKSVLALAGGELQVSAAPDCGTCVTATIPQTSFVEGQWQATS
jgi:two-component system sensor histidine kinase UhpB